MTLGVVVLGGRHAPETVQQTVPAPARTVMVATPIRTHGETVIVVMPLGQDGHVDQALARNVADTVVEGVRQE